MQAHSWCTFLVFVACSTSENDPSEDPPSPPPQPAESPPDMPIPLPDPAEIKTPSCPTGFTANDANAAFGVAAELPSGDCTFEAVRARGKTLQLVWTDAKEAEHVARVVPAACTDLPATGTLALDAQPSLQQACPSVVPALAALIADQTFPTPSMHYVPDAVGPDGDGIAPPHPSASN